MTVVKVENLTKSYGGHSVLQGVHFEANEGEIIGVIGKNGAGKSTFLEILMTLKAYDAGTVKVFNKEINSLSLNGLEQMRQNISAVLQPTQFYENLKVEELLKLFKAYYKSSLDINQLINDFSLKAHRNTYFRKLSGGWKQKVSLAIAFLSQPKLLILDEPTTGLDPHMRETIWNYLMKYNDQTGNTVILSTHNMDEIELYCDKVALLNNGIIETFDTTENLLAAGYTSIHQFYLSQIPA